MWACINHGLLSVCECRRMLYIDGLSSTDHKYVLDFTIYERNENSNASVYAFRCSGYQNVHLERVLKLLKRPESQQQHQQQHTQSASTRKSSAQQFSHHWMLEKAAYNLAVLKRIVLVYFSYSLEGGSRDFVLFRCCLLKYSIFLLSASRVCVFVSVIVFLYCCRYFLLLLLFSVFNHSSFPSQHIEEYKVILDLLYYI